MELNTVERAVKTEKHARSRIKKRAGELSWFMACSQK